MEALSPSSPNNINTSYVRIEEKKNVFVSKRVLYSIFLLQGIGSLLPFHVFITAKDYFFERLMDTLYENSFLAWFTTTYSLVSLLTLVLKIFFLEKMALNDTKMVLSLISLTTFVLLLQSALTLAPSLVGEWFFAIEIFSIAIVSFSATLTQDGFYRLVLVLSPHFTQALTTGQAFAAVIVSVSNFLILLANPSTQNQETEGGLRALLYFLFASGISMLCILTFVYLLKKNVFQDATTRYHHHHHHHHLSSGSSSSSSSSGSRTTSAVSTTSSGLSSEDQDMIHVVVVADTTTTKPSTKAMTMNFGLLWQLMKKIKYYAFAGFMAFFVTYPVFPSVTSCIQSSSSSSSHNTAIFLRQYMVPFVFVVYNCADAMARALCRWIPDTWVNNPKALAWLSIGRLGFVPLFLFCHLENANHQMISPYFIFDQDWIPLIFVFGFAFTNGLVLTLSLMRYRTTLVDLQNPQEKDTAGTLMLFLLLTGLFMGCCLAFGVQALLTI